MDYGLNKKKLTSSFAIAYRKSFLISLGEKFQEKKNKEKKSNVHI